MSTHIGAKPGEIAPCVLMPGDPSAGALSPDLRLRDLVIASGACTAAERQQTFGDMVDVALTAMLG